MGKFITWTKKGLQVYIGKVEIVQEIGPEKVFEMEITGNKRRVSEEECSIVFVSFKNKSDVQAIVLENL